CRLPRRDARPAARVRPRGAGQPGEGGAGARVPRMGGGEPASPFPGWSSVSLLDRVRALLGSDALLESAGPDGVPRVAPDSPDAVALLLGTAREEGWRVRIEGAGTWMPSDAPCDLALTTRRLDRVPAIEPQDLSATAEAGIGPSCSRARGTISPRWRTPSPRRGSHRRRSSSCRLRSPGGSAGCSRCGSRARPRSSPATRLGCAPPRAAV